MTKYRFAFVALLSSLAAVETGAQEFPSRTVTIVSPYQAGGTSDIIARLLAQKAAEIWKQSVVIENKPGANGAIGINTVVRAPADGHALLAVASSALTLNPVVYERLAYDVDRDLAPVTRTGTVANVLVVNPAVEAKTVSELVALAKRKPRGLVYASQGLGSNGHLSAELFAQRAGVEMLHVPYKGSAPAVQDLLSGNVHLMFDNLPSVLSLIQGGKLRAIAVTTAKRSPLLPDVPTVAEAGVAGYETNAWFAVLVSKPTPDALRKQVERGVIDALNDPETTRKLQAAGVDVSTDGSAALEARIKRETSMWRDVVNRAGIRVKQ